MPVSRAQRAGRGVPLCTAGPGTPGQHRPRHDQEPDAAPTRRAHRPLQRGSPPAGSPGRRSRGPHLQTGKAGDLQATENSTWSPSRLPSEPPAPSVLGAWHPLCPVQAREDQKRQTRAPRMLSLGGRPSPGLRAHGRTRPHTGERGRQARVTWLLGGEGTEGHSAAATGRPASSGEAASRSMR